MDKPITPENPDPQTPKQVHLPDDVQDTVSRLKEYIPAAVLGIGLAIIIFIGMTYYRHVQHRDTEEASQLYIFAQQADQFQEIVDRFPRSAVAPAALLALASERFAEGQHELARLHYEQFIADFPEHPMKPSAVLGKAYCDEAMGLLDEALAAYAHFVSEYPDHFLTPMAILAQGRVMGMQGRFEEARDIFSAIAEDEEHIWRGYAIGWREYIDRTERAQLQAQK